MFDNAIAICIYTDIDIDIDISNYNFNNLFKLLMLLDISQIYINNNVIQNIY